MSLNEILKEDITWCEEIHGMSVSGWCDANCGELATKWFRDTNRATCGSVECDKEFEYEYNQSVE